MNKVKKLILIISIISFILILVNFIFYPAYISTVSTCYPEVFEEKYSDTYYIAGQTTINKTTQEIKIELISIDKKTLKHEFIHLKQFENRNVLTCRFFGSQVFFREIEAYTGQHYPDFMYKAIYGDFSLTTL